MAEAVCTIRPSSHFVTRHQKQSEVYETPDVIEEDIEILPTDPQHQLNSEDGPIVSTQFDPSESFKKFQDAALDGRGRDFSDSIGKSTTLASRKSYEVVKRSGAEAGEAGEAMETPMQRFERLRAEVSGFLRDMENIRSSRAQGEESASDELEGVSIVELADRLKIWQSQLQAASKQEGGFDGVMNGGGSVRNVAQSELTNQLLGKISAMKGEIQEGDAVGRGKGTVAYQLVYSKDTGSEMKMAHVADLERRLATLEQVVTGKVAPEPTDYALATSTATVTAPGQSPYPSQGIVASLDDVRAKVSSLDEHAIDQLYHRMSKLTRQYETLKALRHTSQSQSSPSSDLETTTNGEGQQNSHTPISTGSSSLQIDNSKIDKLFHSITHLDTVESELPIVVDRLVQLRSLHEQAVHFSSQITTISSSQTEISSVLATNLAGIQRMQDSLANNMTTIEKNVLALEKRIADVSTLLSK